MKFGILVFDNLTKFADPSLFEQLQFGQWSRYFSVARDTTDPFSLLWFTTFTTGTAFLGGICAEAFLAQRFKLHGNVITTIVMPRTLGMVVWFVGSLVDAPHRSSTTAMA